MRRILIMLLCISLMGAFAGCRAKTETEIETGSTVAQDQTAAMEESIPLDNMVSDVGSDKFEGEFVDETNTPKAESTSDAIPGSTSNDAILESIKNWAGTNLNLSKSNEYDMKPIFGTDQAKSLIKEYKSIKFEDGSIVGYCTYAVPQSVSSTGKGDVVYGDGVDFVDSAIETEAEKLGKASYTDSTKERAFFIITDENKINEFIGFYMNSVMGDLKADTPLETTGSYVEALSEDGKQKVLDFAKEWYAEKYPNYKDLVFDFAKDSDSGYSQYPEHKPGEMIILKVYEKDHPDNRRTCFIAISNSGYEVFNEGW